MRARVEMRVDARDAHAPDAVEHPIIRAAIANGDVCRWLVVGQRGGYGDVHRDDQQADRQRLDKARKPRHGKLLTPEPRKVGVYTLGALGSSVRHCPGRGRSVEIFFVVVMPLFGCGQALKVVLDEMAFYEFAFMREANDHRARPHLDDFALDSEILNPHFVPMTETHGTTSRPVLPTPALSRADLLGCARSALGRRANNV